MSIKRIERTVLLLLNAFLGITAVAGGIGLMTGAISPGTTLLAGSPFHTYLVPGLALLLLVGGSSLLAMALLWSRHRWSVLVAAGAGCMIIIFEVVEILIIGSEAGLARTLQLFYLALGGLIVLLSATLWIGEQQRKVSQV